MENLNRDYAYCVGIGYFEHPELCKNCKRHIPFSQPTEGNLTWTMPQYDEKTGTCPLHEPKANKENNENEKKMSHLGVPTLSYIMKKSGRKPTSCSCEKCKSQCHTPCLGTPDDIHRLIDAGYKDRLSVTDWYAGMILGIIDRPVLMVQANIENGWCTFYHDGKCELHDKGLKPTEGRLSHHSIRIDNFNPKKSLSWLVAKEWLPLQDELKKMAL